MHAPAHTSHRTRAFAVLALAVVGLSFAGPLVRMSSSPALVIAAWRLALSGFVIVPALVFTREWRTFASIGRRDLALALGAGVLLATHFWSWNESLRYTTVAASVTLVNLQPAIVAAVGAVWLGERVSAAQWIGVAIALGGALLVTAADADLGGSHAWSRFAQSGVRDSADGSALRLTGDGRAVIGDLLALVGAVTAAFYYLVGRRVRRSVALWPYVAIVYGTACVVCATAGIATGARLVPSAPREYAIFAALAVGPMLFGHTGMNWALGHLPAFVVNLTTLGEPVGATLLAAALPGIRERPAPLVLAGGALVLAGIVVAAGRSRASQ